MGKWENGKMVFAGRWDADIQGLLLADRKCELGSSMDQTWCISVFCFPAHICPWFASIIMPTETIGYATEVSPEAWTAGSAMALTQPSWRRNCRRQLGSEGRTVVCWWEPLGVPLAPHES